MSTDKALPAERLNLPMRQVQCQISRPKSMSKSAQKSAKTLVFFGQSTFLLCSGGDLNPHALRHTPLKRTCLPFHHPSDSEERNLYHGRCSSQVFRWAERKAGTLRLSKKGKAGTLRLLRGGDDCDLDSFSRPGVF